MTPIERGHYFGQAADGPGADIYLAGKVTGRVDGKFRGIDYPSRVSQNPGSVVLHVHETITTEDGLVSVVRRGYAIPEGTRYRGTATCLFQTGSVKFDFLNRAVGVAEGYADAKGVELPVFEVA